ncbi:MAG: PilZ domain-containing protein [Deltaproteobacteria bacterium]|nr:PilZ domain-containing protein [Deltaproteobacteria bacterium]
MASPPPRPPSPPRTGSNTRQTPRYDVRVSADVQTATGRVVSMHTRNLSEGGVCLEGAVHFPEGAVLAVGLFLVVDEIEDATEAPLTLAGQVTWSEEPGDGEPARMGIRFADVEPAALARLRDFLRALQPPAP